MRLGRSSVNVFSGFGMLQVDLLEKATNSGGPLPRNESAKFAPGPRKHCPKQFTFEQECFDVWVKFEGEGVREGFSDGSGVWDAVQVGATLGSKGEPPMQWGDSITMTSTSLPSTVDLRLLSADFGGEWTALNTPGVYWALAGRGEQGRVGCKL